MACRVGTTKNGFFWEDTVYGAEADTCFATVEAAKADYAAYMGVTKAATGWMEAKNAAYVVALKRDNGRCEGCGQ